MKKLIIILIFPIIIYSQDISHILKVYPDWKTNFSRSNVDFDELIGGGPPKDGIPAILQPKFETIADAKWWLDEVEPVIAVEQNGIAKAYPLQILIWHEIVNDFIGDTPLIVTFCPLCYSAIAFDRRVKNLYLTFGVSGLLRNSDLIMYDTLTHSFWQQFTGEAIVGDFTGSALKIIPSQIISFEEFKLNFPNGKVLSKDTGFERPYGMNPYTGYDNIDTNPFMFKGKIDERLSPNEKVIGIKLAGKGKAYPYSITKEKHVINDVIDSMRIVIFHSGETVSALDRRMIKTSKNVGSTGAFIPKIGDEYLEFIYKDDNIWDKETNSKWSVTGLCTEGEYKGKKLKRIISGDYFAFAWFAFMPNSKVYT
ncbi:MAG: DUF3179 domain-containing protein, partial [Ignavibacteria bacterium]